MIEIVKLLERLGIVLLTDVAPEELALAKSNGLIIVNNIIAASQKELLKIKAKQYLATIGHGKLIDDVEVAFFEEEIVLFKKAATMLAPAVIVEPTA